MDEGRRRTILLVEDEAIIALDEKKVLQGYGYSVLTASTGEAAVELCSRDKGIDLILMDIDLGRGMDGTEAAQAILGLRDLPVVFLSSHSEPEIVEKTEKITSYGYILKNSGVTVLDASIKMAFKLFEANQRTRKAMNKLEATLDAMPDLFFELGLDGEYFDYHSRDEGLLFESPKGFLNRKVPDVLPPEAAEAVMGAIQEAHEFGASSGRQYELSVPAGSKCFEVSACRLIGEHGDEPHFILICRDITEHKRLEDGIRTSNELFQTVLDSIPQYICWKDRNSVFLGCNKKHAELFDLPDTKAIIGKTDWDLHKGKAEIESFIKDDREVMESDSPRYRIREKAIYPNGKERWLETNKIPLHDSAGAVSGVMIAYTDITQRLEEERRRDEDSFLYGAILNASPDGIAISDLRGEILLVSSSVVKLFGIGAEEAKGRHILDFIVAEDRERADTNIRLMLGGVMTGPAEYGGTRGDGSALRIEVNAELIRDAEGRPIKIVYIVRDVAGRKAGEGDPERESRLLQALLETSSDHIYFKDLESRFIRNSRAHARFMGVEDPALLVGRTDAEFFTEEHARQALEDERTVIRTGEAIKKEETNIKPQGPATWVLTEKMPLRDSRGNIIGTFGISRDITERKLDEERIKSLLEEKELILKEVHHRIKNNMSVIQGLLSLQASSIGEPGAIKALRDAEGRIESMTVLYEKLYQSSEFTTVPADDYLNSLIDRMLANASNCEFVVVRKHIEEFSLDIKKAQTLGIIINELISNILKYAFAGRCEGEIEVEGLCRAGRVSVLVRDNGVGMPEEISFEHSTGFGLMLVNALTEQLKGDIRIRRGKGTEILLEFEK